MSGILDRFGARLVVGGCWGEHSVVLLTVCCRRVVAFGNLMCSVCFIRR